MEDSNNICGNIQIPKLLFHDVRFKNMSALAKTAYGFMRDRQSLSKKNADRWTDNQGNVYIYFTIKELADRFGCSEDKAGKIMRELECHKLIIRIRQGQGKPSRVIVNSVVQNPAVSGSRSGQAHVPDCEKNGANKTYKNNKNINNSNKREHDIDEILAIHRMVSAEDYLAEYGDNNVVEN